MGFSIDLRNPRHGWVDVDLRLASQQFAFSASDVLNDPVRELAELALSLGRRREAHSPVCFWLEPAGYELVAATRSGWLTLAMSHSKHASPRLHRPQIVVEEAVERIATAFEILRCLRAARPSFATAGAAGATAWKHPFPETLLSELEGA